MVFSRIRLWLFFYSYAVLPGLYCLCYMIAHGFVQYMTQSGAAGKHPPKTSITFHLVNLPAAKMLFPIRKEGAWRLKQLETPF